MYHVQTGSWDLIFTIITKFVRTRRFDKYTHIYCFLLLV